MTSLYSLNAMTELCVIRQFQRVGGRCEPILKNNFSLAPEQSSGTVLRYADEVRSYGCPR